jgi:hypothetical protein
MKELLAKPAVNLRHMLSTSYEMGDVEPASTASQDDYPGPPQRLLQRKSFAPNGDDAAKPGIAASPHASCKL